MRKVRIDKVTGYLWNVSTDRLLTCLLGAVQYKISPNNDAVYGMFLPCNINCMAFHIIKTKCYCQWHRRSDLLIGEVKGKG